MRCLCQHHLLSTGSFTMICHRSLPEKGLESCCAERLNPYLMVLWTIITCHVNRDFQNTII